MGIGKSSSLLSFSFETFIFFIFTFSRNNGGIVLKFLPIVEVHYVPLMTPSLFSLLTFYYYFIRVFTES